MGGRSSAGLRAERLSWQEVLDVLIGAGRGLAAAHAAYARHNHLERRQIARGGSAIIPP